MSERVKLGKVVPLDTPFSICIGPTYFCNFKCEFCEHSLPENILKKRQYYKTVMDFELFRKIIDDIKNFPKKLKKILFVGMGEPLMHPQIVDMVAYVSEKQIAEEIEIVTNASLLTPKMSDDLIKASDGGGGKI